MRERARAVVLYHRRYYQHNARITNIRHNFDTRRTYTTRLSPSFSFAHKYARARARKSSSSAFAKGEREKKRDFLHRRRRGRVFSRKREKEEREKNISTRKNAFARVCLVVKIISRLFLCGAQTYYKKRHTSRTFFATRVNVTHRPLLDI